MRKIPVRLLTKRRRLASWAIVAGLFLAAPAVSPLWAEGKVLHVGIAPDSPPMEFWERNEISGLEADFAKKLGEELGRKVDFVELKFGRLIPSLLQNEIDIIMSGMSITKIRGLQVAFAHPYMKIGQMPLVRKEDMGQFANPMDIISTTKTVGAREHTTSEFFLVQEFSNAKKRFYESDAQAEKALLSKKIDVLIMDSPYVYWIAMNSNDKLAPVPFTMTEENLGWAVRKSDEDLLASVNAILDKWKQSGELDAMIKKRLPNFN